MIGDPTEGALVVAAEKFGLTAGAQWDLASHRGAAL